MNLGVWRMKDFMQSMCNVFVEVYAYIYIYGRVSWYYILSITSQGAPKSTRAHIYIFGLLIELENSECKEHIWLASRAQPRLELKMLNTLPRFLLFLAA